MRIDDGKQAKPVERVERGRPTEPASEHRQSATPFIVDPYTRNRREQEQHAPRRRVRDSVDLLGVPSNSFAPDAQSAVLALLEEFDRLKQELESSRTRVTELEAMASRPDFWFSGFFNCSATKFRDCDGFGFTAYGRYS